MTTIIKKSTKEVDVIDQTICNKCGTTIYDQNDHKLEIVHGEGIEVDHRFGYYSKMFGDQTYIMFHLCELCLWDLVSGFKLPCSVKILI